MGRGGDCVTCDSRQRGALEVAREVGASFADLSRTYGIPATSIRRHFRRGHALPKPKPAPKVTGPVLTRGELEKVAAELDIPFVEMLGHVIHCLGGDVSTATDEEACELVTLLDGHPHQHV